MADVKHIFHIHPSTGNIERVDLSPADLPPEGTGPEGLYIKYCYEDIINCIEFIETHYFDFITEDWVYREKPPNPFCSWNSQQQKWEWNSENLLNQIRDFRNQKLLACDWTALPDAPLSESEKTEALNYRQALRDLPSSLDMSVITSIEDVTWPAPPAFIGDTNV